MSRVRLVAAAFPMAIAGAGALVALARGCSAPPTAGGSAGGASADADAADADSDAPNPEGGNDAGSDVDDAGPDACPNRGIPSDVPAGWEEYTDWACNCPFYVPSDVSELPEPIEWEPCPSNAPPGLDCRHMRPTWNDGGAADEIDETTARMTLLAPAQMPAIAFRRLGFRSSDGKSAFMVVIADADGPVHSAIYQRHGINDGCYLAITSLNGRHYSMDAVGDDQYVPHDYELQGSIGGDIDELHPRVILRHENVPKERGYSAFVSRDYIVEWRSGGTLTLMDWAMTSSEEIYGPGMVPVYLPGWMGVISGEDIFFDAAAGGQTGIMSWDREHGTRPLRRWYYDQTRGAGNLGTDGKTMVWLEGNGRPDAGAAMYDFNTVDVMTAPHSTDPAELQAKAVRLRSSPRPTVGIPGEEFFVGCGYAVRHVGGPCELDVIRLADGYQWSVACVKEGSTWRWAWTRALGVTCDEVFATAYYDDGARKGGTIARIRLDSLGAPTPPD